MTRALKYDFWFIGILLLIDLIVLSVVNFKSMNDAEIFSFILFLIGLIGLFIINLIGFKDVKNKTQRLFYGLLITGAIFISWFILTSFINWKLFFRFF